jgi:hypothetical protein
MTLESKYGVPTVQFHTDIFERVVRSVIRVAGMPEMRRVFVPMPVMGKSPAELRDYVYGNDCVTGKPVMQEVLEGLTEALVSEELPTSASDRSTPRLLDPDSEDNLHAMFLENRWTDMLPIVLPTEARVAAMLSHTSHKPDEVIGRMQPTQHRGLWEYTVEKVAVNAVMAGARPEYFPVILALAASGITARSSSSSSHSNMVVVNGPIRHEIDMNSGIGALGPFNHANATIGRAYGLLSQNLQGGSVPGQTYMGSQGNGYTYNNLTFAENEEASPWEPFHVQHGFKAEDSTVSIWGGIRCTAFDLGLREGHWRENVRDMLRGMDPLGGANLILDPITARQFIDRGGFTKKADLIQWVHDNACMPAAQYWDHQLIQNYIVGRATLGEEPHASKYRAAPDELINIFTPENIQVVVVGGATNGYWQIMGGSHRRTVSVDDWR